MERIKILIEQYQVDKIVLGFPKNMNNTLGFRAEKLWNSKKIGETIFN